MTTSIHDVPGTQTVTTRVPAHAAGDATASHLVFVAPFTCRVRAVQVTASAGVTGANTNTFNLNVIRRPGTTELGNRDFTSGTNLAAFTPTDVYRPATPPILEAGQVLDLQRELVGTGLATPELLATVEFEGA